MPEPYLDDADLTLYHGDVSEVLRDLPADHFHCVVTSPPYFGLRDYGDDQQLGLEPTPEAYVERLVEVFREVRRVLRPDGTVWLNLGDSYSSGDRDSYADDPLHAGRGHRRRPRSAAKPKELLLMPARVALALQADGWYVRADVVWGKPNPMPESVLDRPTKSHEHVYLLTRQPSYFYDREATLEPFQPGSAERYDYGFGGPKNRDLQEADGHGQGRTRMVGRRDVAGPPPPQAETLDPSLPPEAPRGADGRRKTARVEFHDGRQAHADYANAYGGERWPGAGRNMRDVWTIPVEPYKGAHFAVFPAELPRRCILAGTSERGVCPDCGAPWARVVELGEARPVRGEYLGPIEGDYKRDGSAAVVYKAGRQMVRTSAGWSLLRRDRDAVGWRPTCSCYDALYERDFPRARAGKRWQRRTWRERSRRRAVPEAFGWPTAPARVLDIFAGSGTTAQVCRDLGRASSSIELSAAYCALIAERTRQLSLLAVEGAA